MVFVCKGEKMDTFQIRNIDHDNNEITLWDGWGKAGSPLHEKKMSFHEFMLTIKHLKKKNSDFYRLNTSKKPLNVDVFNSLCFDKSHYDDDQVKRF
jgi:uncharacterized protein YdcH (DUF465 family)